MNPSIPCIGEHGSVADAVSEMARHRTDGVVVVDSDRWPIGVITDADIAHAALSAESLRAIYQSDAMNYASKEPIWMPIDTEIGMAFHHMLGSGITLLPVIEQGALAGIVTRAGIMAHLIQDIETR